MDFFGLTMFSILIAIFGYFQSIPLTGVDRLQDGLSKGYALGHFGMMVDRFFPVAYANDSFENSELQYDTTSAVLVSTSPEPKSDSVVDSALTNSNTSTDDTTGYTTHIVPLVADWNESDPWIFRDTQYFDLIADRTRYVGFSSQIWSAAQSFSRVAVLLGLPIILVSVLFVAFVYWRDVRTADAEIMRFTNEVRSRRASLQRKIDLASYAIDQTLDDIVRHISAQQERIHQDLASFRPDDVISQEMGAFREKLELLIQSEFDRQASWVKDYLEELEQVRQTLPGPAEIRAQCDELQEIFQQAKEVHNSLNGTLKHIDELLNSRPVASLSQGSITLVDEFHAVRSISSNEGTGSSNVSERIRENTHLQPQSLSQWVMASGRHAMTPEEFDKAREIRRERVKMRCANRVKANSASTNGQSGRNCRF
ncbi:hypothetical protein SI65_05593 [Aspergillus cristatus]|uniref:Uncharacterized protein n=1 Tax=Aspergillus cristatus TaxID=573508 RepID=A0A1E3BF14_ASPCR|nr:hypothetical protein SI65_05593 [Aspergillus cristatus]